MRTVVTDAPEVLDAALAAARQAQADVPGALGVHVEGPFIDPRRKGVHPAQWICPLCEADATALIGARAGVTVVTRRRFATPLIERLARARVIVRSVTPRRATRRRKRRSTPARDR